MRLPICLLLLAPTLAAAECRYSADRNFDVPAAGLGHVSFDLGSSDLVVEGAPGLANVEVRARACASDPAWVEALTVEQRRSGDGLEITPRDSRDAHGTWFGSQYAYIELHVRVPAALGIVIRGESGDVQARGVAALDLTTSSGDLVAAHVAGELRAAVASGDIRAEDIGSVDVTGTGSGDIRLADVHGPSEIGHSGSGDLDFDRVGSVMIGSVGSGDVSIVHAGGDVSIDSIGSGDVSVDDVDGAFRVGSRGSGDIEHRGVRGTVSVPRDDD
ncbi:MAG TPA: DUF4097 family beta strand repeat-containing protein [Rhodanobacteraceae bacterium]|nr:DUF4097 family beta strand repeat-containing protein [Rhodanobacteraceae bacterium]